MAKNLASCLNCGHSVNNAPGVCAYCGAVITVSEPSLQTDEKIREQVANSPEPAPALEQEKTPPAAEMSEGSKSALAYAAGRFETDFSDPTPAIQSNQLFPKLPREAASRKSEEELVIERSDGLQIVESTAEASRETSDTMASEVSDLVDNGIQPAPEKSQPLDKAIADTPSGDEEDALTPDSENIKFEARKEKKAEASEEAVLLSLEAEVKPLLKDSPDGANESAQMETPKAITETTAEARQADAKPDVLTPEGKAQAGAEGIQEKAEVKISAKDLKIEKAAQDMAEAIKKQKATLARALIKEKQILTKARAEKQNKVPVTVALALKKQKKEQAEIEASKKQKTTVSTPAPADSRRMIVDRLETKTKIMDLLKKYKSQAIGINYDNSADIKEAELIEANDEFFSVFVKDKQLHYNYPLSTILTVIEGKDGIAVDDPGQKGKFSAVIKVHPLCFPS